MKIELLEKEIAAESTTITRQQFDEATQANLHGLTVREACRKRLITHFGDENGDLVFKHNKFDDLYVALNINYIVKCSKPLKAVVKEYGIPELMNCVFSKGISTIPGEGFNKPFWVLGKAKGLDLDSKAVVSFSVVEAGK